MSIMLVKLQEQSLEKDNQLAAVRKQLAASQTDQQKLMKDFQDQVVALSSQNKELQTQIQKTSSDLKSRPSNASGFEDEVKRQLQVLVVKEAEVEALRKQVKKYKD